MMPDSNVNAVPSRPSVSVFKHNKAISGASCFIIMALFNVPYGPFVSFGCPFADTSKVSPFNVLAFIFNGLTEFRSLFAATVAFAHLRGGINFSTLK